MNNVREECKLFQLFWVYLCATYNPGVGMKYRRLCESAKSEKYILCNGLALMRICAGTKMNLKETERSFVLVFL